MNTMFIDATSVALWNHKNYNAIPSPLEDKRVLYGFIRLIYRAVSEQEINRVIIVNDGFSLSHKNRLLLDYKQTEYIPPGVTQGLKDLEVFCILLNIPYLHVICLDSVDVIATLGRITSESDEIAYLVSACDYIQQVHSNKVKVVSPQFVMSEGGVFADYTKDKEEAQLIDFYILMGSHEKGIPAIYNDLNISPADCRQVAKDSLASFLANFPLTEAIAGKIDLIRRLLMVNSHLELPDSMLDVLMNPTNLKPVEIMAAAGNFSLDIYLTKDFSRGTAYPPSSEDYRQKYYDHMLVGSGEYCHWSMARLAQYDKSLLIKEIQDRGLQYVNRDYKEAFQLALGFPLRVDVDPATAQPGFILCLTDPAPNDCDYSPCNVEPKERTTFIYGLYDPREPDIFRYVGKANNPQKRLLQHIKEAERVFVQKDDWIYSLLRLGISPEVKVIEEIRYRYDFEWGDREILHIQNAAKRGRIYNMASGGEDRFSVSPWRVADKELDFRYRNWKKRPTPENQEGLWRAQLRIIKWRIIMRGGSFCKYCFSYIPGVHASPVTFNDLLQYPPLTELRDLWRQEEVKHSPRCSWWRTGVVGIKE